MSPERQRVVIAELCGWDHCRESGDKMDHSSYWYAPDSVIPPGWKERHPSALRSHLPDYLNDLNAMHQAKRKLLTTLELCDRFNEFLIQEKPAWSTAPFETDKWTWGQSAEVQSRALIKTLDKWEERE